MLRWLFVPVLVLLLLALAVGFLDRPAAPAQGEPSIFTELRLEETSPGAYRLDVSIQNAVISYRVGVRTWATGTDHGVDPQISIGVPDSATPRCGYALVLVWAIGPDGPSSLPGNTTVAACFSTAGIHFPAVGPDGVVALPGAGAGTEEFVDHRVRLGAAVALGIVGALVVLAGAATARR